MSARRRKRAGSKVGRNVRRDKAGKRPATEKKRVSKAEKAGQKAAEKAAVKAVAGWRLWVFRGAAVFVVPVLFLFLVEVGLRVAGYGYPSDAIVKVEVEGKSYCCDNVK